MPAAAAMPPLTASINRFWDDPFGAVRLALGPSCYTADARIAAQQFEQFEPFEPRNRNAPHPSPRQ